MTILHEFRIPLNMTVEEFQVAQLFVVMKASEAETGGGEGVEVVKNEPYDNTDGKLGKSELSGIDIPRDRGQYTLKKYYLASKLPTIVTSIVPRESTVLIEEAWNAYPHCTTIITNGYLSKDKFYICIESVHLSDRADNENVLNLAVADLKKRKVEILDIGKPLPGKKKPVMPDSASYKSQKTARGPLTGDWIADSEPVMTCYKIVRAKFDYWPVSGKVESLILDAQRGLFHGTLGQAFTTTDEWHGLTMDDIRRLEDEAKLRLEEKRAHGQVVQSNY